MSTENIEMTNALLSANWDEIDDLPSYINFPTGSWMMRITQAEVKEPRADDDEPDVSVRVHVELLEVLEYNGDADAPAIGSLGMYTFKGQKGIRRLKMIFGAIGQTLGANNPLELIDRLAGLELGITTQASPNKSNPDRPYSNLISAVMP